MPGRICCAVGLCSLALAPPALAQPPAPERVDGSGTVLATTYDISVSGGSYGENPTGTLTLQGAYDFTAGATCMNVDAQGAVVGFRIETGSMAGQGFLAGPESLPELASPPGRPVPVTTGGATGSSPSTIFYAALPTPPTACPPPGSPPPDTTSGSGTINGSLNRSGGPANPVFFQQATFPAPGAGALAQASDGSIWFLEPGADRIATTGNDGAGSITAFPLPTADAGLAGIAPDTAGVCDELGCASAGMWFTEATAGKVGHVAGDGTVAEYAAPGPGADPSAISADRATGGAWFTEPTADRIGHIAPDGTITEYPVPVPSANPAAIAGDGSGGAWFAERGAGAIGHIDATGTITEFPLPGGDAPGAITAERDGPGAWFTEPAANAIGHIDQMGATASFTIPTPAVGLAGITAGAGPDGTSGAWFAEPADDGIGFVSADGRLSEFTAVGAQPTQLAYADTLGVAPLSGYGTSAAVWFTDAATGVVGFARIPRSNPAVLVGGGGGGGIPRHHSHHHHLAPIAFVRAPTLRHGLLTVELQCRIAAGCRARLLVLGRRHHRVRSLSVRIHASRTRTVRVGLGSRRARSVEVLMGGYGTVAPVARR